MTDKQKIALRLSEIRAKMASLSKLKDWTEEQNKEVNELRNEYQQLETRMQAIIISEAKIEGETEGEPEPADRQELRKRAEFSQVLQAATGGASTSGATAELQQELNLRGNQVPLEIMFPRPIETRAITPAPANVGRNQATIIPHVYPAAVAAFFNIAMPTVPAGQHSYPYISTPATVRTPAESADAAETTGAFTANLVNPSRLQASFYFSREDRASFAGMAEALRMNLSDALGDGLDNQVINNTSGLVSVTQTNAGAANAQANFAAIIDAVEGSVDGRYAKSDQEIKVILGVATHTLAVTLRRGNSADLSVVDTLREETGGVMVSANVAAVSSKHQDMFVRLGSRMDAVAPVWEGIELIEDPYTRSGTGEIEITAVMLYGVQVIRSDAFRRLAVQTAA